MGLSSQSPAQSAFAFALVPALGAATVVALTAAPAGAAQVTTTVPVTHACQGIFPWLSSSYNTTVSPDNVEVNYPDGVAPGEVFTATIAPGAMATTNSATGRLSYDLALPAGATVLSAVAGSPTNLTGNPQVDRIRTDGTADAAGGFLRVWGGSDALGPNASSVGGYGGGLSAATSTTFRLPTVSVTMRAPVTAAAGARFVLGYRGDAAGHTNSAENALVYTEDFTAVSHDNIYCGRSANGGALTTTAVTAGAPVHLASTVASMVTPDTAVLTGSGATTLTARVDSSEETTANLRKGTMTFTVTDKTTGAVLRTVSGVAIAADGTATTTNTFAPLTAGELSHPYSVSAAYSGVAGDIAPARSDASTVTVGYREHVADTVLSSQNGTLTGGKMTIKLSGKVTMTDGVAIPSGAKVQLLRDGVALGAPVTVGSGGAVTFPDDTLVQQKNTVTYRYAAQFIPILNGLDRYSGVSSNPVAAIVTGTSPNSTVPSGGFDISGSSTLIADPLGLNSLVTGSVSALGTFSVNATR